MDVFTTLKKRGSIRSYLNTPVEDEKLTKNFYLQ